ncbi:MAG: hypothetical protein ABI790_11335, partial [Betaproteobacteria bacterium]
PATPAAAVPATDAKQSERTLAYAAMGKINIPLASIDGVIASLQSSVAFEEEEIVSLAGILLIEARSQLKEVQRFLDSGLVGIPEAQADSIASSDEELVDVDTIGHVYELQAQLRGAAAVLRLECNFECSDELMAAEKLIQQALKTSGFVIDGINCPLTGKA